MPRFDAVLFDAGGVLVLPDPTVIGPLLARYGGSTDVDLHRRAHYAAMKAKSDAHEPEGSWEAYDDEYVIRVGVDAADRTEASFVLGRTRTAWLWRWMIPETRVALDELAGAGVPLGVVSNASGQIEAVLIREVCQVGPGDHVEMRCIVDSQVVGVAKPDPAIFDHALAALRRVRTVTHRVRGRLRHDGHHRVLGSRASSDPARPLRRPCGRRFRAHPGRRRPRRGTHPLTTHRDTPPQIRKCIEDARSARILRHFSAVRRVVGEGQAVEEMSWRAMTLRQRVSSAPSKIDSTRASTNRRLTGNSSA